MQTRLTEYKHISWIAQWLETIRSWVKDLAMLNVHCEKKLLAHSTPTSLRFARAGSVNRMVKGSSRKKTLIKCPSINTPVWQARASIGHTSKFGEFHHVDRQTE